MCSLQEHSERSYREEMARQAAAKQPVIVDKLNELDWLSEVVEDAERNQRVRGIPATGELLPAEERLQNVLKAIEDRIRKERAVLDTFVDDYDRDSGQVSMQDIICQRGFLAGLDIAWSLAKTESLRTDGSGPTVAPGSV